MTQKEKAAAYDRALEVLHKYDGAPIMFTEDLKEEMFPELKKNRDEEIRQALIDGFTVMKESKNCGKTFSNHNILVTDILNWLERQGGEQKPTETENTAWNEEDEKYLNLSIENFQMLGNSYLTAWLQSLKDRVQRN